MWQRVVFLIVLAVVLTVSLRPMSEAWFHYAGHVPLCYATRPAGSVAYVQWMMIGRPGYIRYLMPPAVCPHCGEPLWL